MVLRSGNSCARVSLQDVASQVELPLVAGDSVQFDQRHFDFRVAGDDRLLWVQDRS